MRSLKMSLLKYRKKRKFNSTPEPQGRQIKHSGPLKFVVQKHQARALHYDFRLETGGVLKSWAVPRGPSLNGADKRLAMMVEDHPIDYMKFEGIIPEGNYGAGTVMVWDFGNYLAIGSKNGAESEKLMQVGLKKGVLKIVLNGSKLKGAFALIKTKFGGPFGRAQGRPEQSRGGGKDNAWLLIKEKDPYVSKANVTKKDKSALSGKTMAQIAVGKTKI